LKLQPVVSAEEVVESFFRCLIADHLTRRFSLEVSALPGCMNASHRAARGVCVVRKRHRHLSVPDVDWAAAWLGMQSAYPAVNVRVPGRSPKRADLYVVAKRQIVSLEFKYVGGTGLRGVESCIAQMRRHADNHARA